MAYAGEMVAPDRLDPILVPEPRRPLLSCVGESEFRCEGDLEGDRREWKAVQAP